MFVSSTWPDFGCTYTILFHRRTIAAGLYSSFYCPDRVDSSSARFYHFPVRPASEQILVWPYQQEPQRAEGEVGRMLRGERVLWEAANDRPRSLMLGLRQSTLTATISMLTGKSKKYRKWDVLNIWFYSKREKMLSWGMTLMLSKLKNQSWYYEWCGINCS